MDRRKLTSAVLFFTVFGTLMFLPPLVQLFNLHVRIFGIPAEVVYLFVVWLVLIAGTAAFAYRLPHDNEDAG